MSDMRPERIHGEHKPKPCQGDPHELICRDINAWMKLMYDWAQDVTRELNALLEATGDPDKVPPPPRPPFE